MWNIFGDACRYLKPIPLPMTWTLFLSLGAYSIFLVILWKRHQLSEIEAINGTLEVILLFVQKSKD